MISEPLRTRGPVQIASSLATLLVSISHFVNVSFFSPRAINFYRSCARASQNIHDWCFKGFISATKRFFDVNPSGRILNRFSKDMGAMDEWLPKSIMDATQSVLTIIGAMLVILIVQPFFLIPILILLLILLYTRRIYMKTSQNSRRLEGISKFLRLLTIQRNVNNDRVLQRGHQFFRTLPRH